MYLVRLAVALMAGALVALAGGAPAYGQGLGGSDIPPRQLVVEESDGSPICLDPLYIKIDQSTGLQATCTDANTVTIGVSAIDLDHIDGTTGTLTVDSSIVPGTGTVRANDVSCTDCVDDNDVSDSLSIVNGSISQSTIVLPLGSSPTIAGRMMWEDNSGLLHIGQSGTTTKTFYPGSHIANVVEDTTPQLGGNLDMNGKSITNTTPTFTLTPTEMSYLDGVTSSIQTQLNGKAASSHTHVEADITDLSHQVTVKRGGTGTDKAGTLDFNTEFTLSCTAGTCTIGAGTSFFMDTDTLQASQLPGVAMRTDTDETVGSGVTHTYGSGSTLDASAATVKITANSSSIPYSNSSGAVTGLALGDDGTMLTSTGTTAAPAFKTPWAWTAEVTATMTSTFCFSDNGSATLCAFSNNLFTLFPVATTKCSGIVAIQTAPGSGVTWDFKLRSGVPTTSQDCKNATMSNSGTLCSITGATQKSCTFTAATVSISAMSCVQGYMVATGTPAAPSDITMSVYCW